MESHRSSSFNLCQLFHSSSSTSVSAATCSDVFWTCTKAFSLQLVRAFGRWPRVDHRFPSAPVGANSCAEPAHSKRSHFEVCWSGAVAIALYYIDLTTHQVCRGRHLGESDGVDLSPGSFAVSQRVACVLQCSTSHWHVFTYSNLMWFVLPWPQMVRRRH